MKLTFSPASPFARKVRIAAIELGLIDKIEFMPATVAPGQPNDEYSQDHPGEEAAGADPRQWRRDPGFLCHRRISRRTRRRRQADPGIGPDALEGQERSFAAAGHAGFDAAVPLRAHGAAEGTALAGLVRRSLEPGLERHGAFREPSGHAGAAVRHLADRRSSACSAMPISALPIAAGRRPTRNSTPSIRRCWSGRRSRSRCRRRPNRSVFGERCHEPEIQRRRFHHPSHHRAGNHLPAGAGRAADADAGAVGGEPALAAKGRRARRQRHADPVFPVLHRQDAASHHSDRQLHRQRQAAAAAPEMEHEDRRHLHARAGGERAFPSATSTS